MAASLYVGHEAPSLPRPGVTVGNFKRLHRGMSREDVERVIGKPAEVHGQYFIHPTSTTPLKMVWTSDECEIVIFFRITDLPAWAMSGECTFETTCDKLELNQYEEGPWHRFLRWLFY